MSDVAVREGVCRLRLPGARWLSTGIGGGFERADAAVNVTVPGDFDRRDPGGYVAERCDAAGFEAAGPALLTAVEQVHARGARAGSVTVVATAGLSNPARLPVTGAERATGGGAADASSPPPVGTVNLLVATERSLEAAALASCLATAVEAKAATLRALTGFSGTTSDAVAVGSDPAAEEAAFVGSSTAVGGAVRACVRDAVRASLDSHYDDREPPDSVADAEHGVRTTRTAAVFDP